MAISQKRISRKLKAGDAGTVAEFPPSWSFELVDERGEKTRFDFHELRVAGREQLATQLRDAVWSQRLECRPSTLKRQVWSFQSFCSFLDEQPPTGGRVTSLKQVDRQLLDRFVGWLNLQLVSDASKPGYGQPLALGSRSSIYASLKSFLVNRRRHVPGEVSPQLSFPRNPFPNKNRNARRREGYSDAEHKRIVSALNIDLRSIHGQQASLPPLQVLAVHLLVLGLATGRNLQPLLDLTRDSLHGHPAPDRDLLVTHKNRGYSTHATSVRKAKIEPTKTMLAIPASIGDHLRFLCDHTAHLADEADGLKEYVFLWRHTKFANKGRIAVLNQGNAIKAFAERHELVNDDGTALVLNMARLRPTFATEIYRRTGDVRRVQQALGHASARTAARHYIGVLPESERNHSFVIEGMTSQFTRHVVEGKVLLAADGSIPASDVKDLLTGGYNTGIASCQNPFRDADSVCKKFFSCFKCPSMMVFEDDLWRLFSFYYRLLSERAKIGPAQWLKTYAPIVKRIDVDIASQFPPIAVNDARLRAQASPHPAWR